MHKLHSALLNFVHNATLGPTKRPRFAQIDLDKFVCAHFAAIIIVLALREPRTILVLGFDRYEQNDTIPLILVYV